MGRSRGKIPNHKWDILYGITAVVIFIMAVMALSNPDENKVLFPFLCRVTTSSSLYRAEDGRR